MYVRPGTLIARCRGGMSERVRGYWGHSGRDASVTRDVITACAGVISSSLSEFRSSA